MKTVIIFLAFALLAPQAFSQRKSKKEPAADPAKVQIDSLTKVSKDLALQLDSVSGELVKYMAVYNVIKEKVLHYNFDPAKSEYIIDSLKASRDSLFSQQDTKKLLTASADSINMLLKSNALLKTQIDSLRLAWEKSLKEVPKEELERSTAITNLMQLKELYDNKVITQAEYITLKKKYINKL